MRNFINATILLSLLGLGAAHAMTVEESKVAMTEHELQLMKDGFKYVEPTPEQKESGVISIYEKSKCTPGHECEIKNLTSEELKKKIQELRWSGGNIAAPNGMVKARQNVGIVAAYHVEIENENEKNICIQYDMSLVDDRSGAVHSETLHGCMSGYGSYAADHQLMLTMNYPAPGKYPNTVTLDIFDVPHGRAQIKGLIVAN